MHLSSYQITRYRHAGLAPAELLTIDDHLVTCEFCRQQLRSGLNWQTAIENIQTNLFGFTETDNHISSEQHTALLCNQLTLVERELVTSHLQVCSICAMQAQCTPIGSVDTGSLTKHVWVRLLTFLQDRAALIWPMPVAALFVVVMVTIADSFYLRHVAKTKAATIMQSSPTTPGRKFDAFPQPSKAPSPQAVH